MAEPRHAGRRFRAHLTYANVATGNNQIALMAGAFIDFGGPGTQNGAGDFRVNARAILVGQSRTITFNLFELVDAGTGRCSLGGTALPSS